ncbi:MAG: hypothetical protein M1383_03950 [Patescibacteria group bacterium]|nr:hypothetical protein [Patescibacteria group bacterium]
MGQIQNIYLQLLENFPAELRPVISIGLAILLIYSAFKVVKKDFIYIIALVILLPASKPILLSVWQGMANLVEFLLHTK